MSVLSVKIAETEKVLDKAYKEDSDHLNFYPLRDLSRFCNNLTLESSSSFDRMISYVIFKLIDDIFTNFNVDTIYNIEVNEARRKIYVGFLDNLPKIHEALIKIDTKEIFSHLGAILEIYIEQVNYLNKRY